MACVQLSLDLVGRWMEEHAGAAMLEGVTGGGEEERDLTIRGLATYQPSDGILVLKMVSQRNPPIFPSYVFFCPEKQQHIL